MFKSQLTTTKINGNILNYKIV